MNEVADPDHGNCEAPEDPEHSNYTVDSNWVVGSIKWAKLFNFPPWPVIIDDNPDTKTSVWIHTNGQEKVHVVFFNALLGSITRDVYFAK